MLSHHIKQILSQFNPNEEKHGNKLLAIESAYTLLKLFSLTEELAEKEKKESVDLDLLKPFQDFFAKRWEIIQDSPLAYYYAPHTTETTLCYQIAQILAESLNLLPYQILMPSVELTESISLRSWSERPLHAFIISTDKRRYIDVAETLEFAEEDGRLKHTCLVDEKKSSDNKSETLFLDAEECKHIEDHSRFTKDYFYALQNVSYFKNNGNSIGAAISQLITQLRAGGKEGGRDGTETKAGRNAVEGIKKFYFFLRSLTSSQKSKLFKCTALEVTTAPNFEAAWLKLITRITLEGTIVISEKELKDYLNKLDEKYPSDQAPCVELISDDLEIILKNHPELFTMIPNNKEKKETLSELIAYREETKIRLTRALETLTYPVECRRHREDCYSDLAGKIFLRIEEFSHFIPGLNSFYLLYIILESVFSGNFSQFILKFGHHIRGNIETANEFCLLLSSDLVTKSSHQLSLISHLGRDFFQGLFQDRETLVAVNLQLSAPQFNALLGQLGAVHIKSLIPHESLMDIISPFEKKHRLTVLKNLGLEFVTKNIRTAQELVQLLTHIDANDESEFLLMLGPKFLQGLVHTTIDLIEILGAIHIKEHRYTFFQFDQEFFKRVISTREELAHVLKFLHQNNYLTLLKTMGVKFLNNLIQSPEHFDAIFQIILSRFQLHFCWSYVKVQYEKIGGKDTLRLLDKFSADKALHIQLLRCYNGVYSEQLEYKLNGSCSRFFDKKIQRKIDASVELEEVFLNNKSMAELKEHSKTLSSGTLKKIVARM